MNVIAQTDNYIITETRGLSNVAGFFSLRFFSLPDYASSFCFPYVQEVNRNNSLQEVMDLANLDPKDFSVPSGGLEETEEFLKNNLVKPDWPPKKLLKSWNSSKEGLHTQASRYFKYYGTY